MAHWNIQKIETMSNAFPIRSRNRFGMLTGGTGFCANYKGRFWLITAAHVALAENDLHGRWQDWPDEIGARVGQEIAINLFDSQRRPLFAFKTDGEQVADIVAFDLSLLAQELKFANALAFDLSAPWSVEVGDRITALGFPTDFDNWPQPVAVTKHFETVRLSPGIIEHVPSAGNGMSGGPVINSQKSLVGLVIGHNHGIGRCADVNAIRWIIDSSLPDMPPLI
jgi:hypothetical protein